MRGARHWHLEEGIVLARRPYNRLVADDRFAIKQILTEAHYCLHSLLSASGYSAYRLIFGSNPADVFGRGGDVGGLLLAQDASRSGQFARRREFRVTAREAAWRDAANSKRGRASAISRPFNSADVRRRRSQRRASAGCPRCDSGHGRRRRGGEFSGANV